MVYNKNYCILKFIIVNSLRKNKKERYDMKLSARNQLKGVIKEIENGAVNAVVKLDIGGGNIISATISMDAVKALNLSVGKEAYAVIKSTSVMVGVE